MSDVSQSVPVPDYHRPPVLEAVLGAQVDRLAQLNSEQLGEFWKRLDSPQRAETWNAVERKLIEWGRDPSQLEDDGISAPAADTIRLAIQLASELSRQGLAAPTRVVPDAHGSIVFELLSGNRTESIHVRSSGIIELRRLEDHQLQASWKLEAVNHP